MLVLSRQRDETIMIGDDVEITVVDIRGDKVRLGITAPTKIAVHRKEVYDAIKSENERAARINNSDVNALSPAALSAGRPKGLAKTSFGSRNGLGAARLGSGPINPLNPLNPNSSSPAAGGPPHTGLGNAQTA